MNDFVPYLLRQIAQFRPYRPGEDMTHIYVSDTFTGSPKYGDIIVRDPKNHNDQWLITQQFFWDHYEPL